VKLKCSGGGLDQ